MASSCRTSAEPNLEPAILASKQPAFMKGSNAPGASWLFAAWATPHIKGAGMANCLAAQMTSLSVSAQASTSGPATVRF